MIISSEPPSPSARIDKAHPALVRLQERFLLTGESSTKKTFHVSLNVKESGIQFKVGDSVGIFAENDPILVTHLIAAMHATGEEIILDPRTQQEISLRTFLTRKANLSRLTSSFLKLFSEYEPLHDKKNHLHRLLQQENKPLLSQYLSLHDPLDLFKEYQEVKVPLQEICTQFGPLLPRFYSVASSNQPNPINSISPLPSLPLPTLGNNGLALPATSFAISQKSTKPRSRSTSSPPTASHSPQTTPPPSSWSVLAQALPPSAPLCKRGSPEEPKEKTGSFLVNGINRQTSSTPTTGKSLFKRKNCGSI